MSAVCGVKLQLQRLVVKDTSLLSAVFTSCVILKHRKVSGVLGEAKTCQNQFGRGKHCM